VPVCGKVARTVAIQNCEWGKEEKSSTDPVKIEGPN
jgi:hypothetical protein